MRQIFGRRNGVLCVLSLIYILWLQLCYFLLVNPTYYSNYRYYLFSLIPDTLSLYVLYCTLGWVILGNRKIFSYFLLNQPSFFYIVLSYYTLHTVYSELSHSSFSTQYLFNSVISFLFQVIFNLPLKIIISLICLKGPCHKMCTPFS